MLKSPQSDFDTCIQTIRKSDNIEESKAISEKYLNKAIALIEELEEGPKKFI